jgi:hypothetical protein
MMRNCFSVICLAVAGCVSPEPANVALSNCNYSSLAQVASDPIRANGKKLCADLYSFSSHGFLAFYDRPIHSTAQAIKLEALLIGEEDAVREFRGNYPKDGKKVSVRGTLNLQLSCFSAEKNSCVPIAKPVYVDAPVFALIPK